MRISNNRGKWAILVIGALLISGVSGAAVAAEKQDKAAMGAEEKQNQAKIVASGLTAIANQLALRPETAIDFSKVSGEYCFDVRMGQGGHMTHYAIDPTKSQEDVIDFVNAAPLVKAGVNLESLPKFPGKLGSMTPNQWYFLSAGELEPHHGVKLPFPIMLRASDVK